MICLSRTLIAFLLTTYAQYSIADGHDVFGLFMTEAKTSHVLIKDCGDGTPCGTVVWVDPESLDPGETPETLKTKSGVKVVGLKILKGFKKSRTGWRGGEIYSPPADKTYASRLRRLENRTLQVKGCISVFCTTQIWTFVEPIEPESTQEP